MTDEQKQKDAPEADPMNAGYTSAKRTGLVIAFLVFGVFGVWATTAPIDGASHATGAVAVRSHKKVVQHLEGGIIAEILVDNGSVVSVGDPLILLDTTQAGAQLQMTNAQLNAALAREARLIAERDERDGIRFPDELEEAGANASAEIQAQKEIFAARKRSREGQLDMLEQRVEQLQSRLSGLRGMQESKESLLASYEEELEEVRGLLADGFSDTNRLRSVQRSHDQLRGEVSELLSDIATTEMQVNETRTEMLQLVREFESEVVTELGDTQSRIKELREQRIAQEDVFRRQVVRAPESGVVNGLEVHTVGGVIGPGNQIAEIVPEGDELIIEARVAPVDIDRVAVGQEASVTLSAYSSQTTPRLTGTVLHVSADAMEDQQTGATYYLARIGVDPSELEALPDVTLVPGMPAEVFISSGSRTLMQYLLKPLSSAMRRSFIED